MDMKRPIAALLSCLVTPIGQSAGATNYHVYRKSEALCQFDPLKRHSPYTLVAPFDLAYADAGGDHSIDEAAPRSAQTAYRSEKRLARGGPLHLYHSSAGETEHETAHPAARGKKKFTGHGRN
jgi:hypothetical protein